MKDLAPGLAVFLVVVAAGHAKGQGECVFSPLPPFDSGGSVSALLTAPGPSGTELYIGGTFAQLGGQDLGHLARFDGSLVQSVGGGVSGGVLSKVSALAWHDDGSGPALFVAGTFDNAGGVPAQNIARFDGAQFHALGGGLSGGFPFPRVEALTVFDDGGGPALYAGGAFSTASGAPAANIARWDGAAWSGVSGGTDGTVRALAVFDDGTGPALYAAGEFSQAGGVPVGRIARFDGGGWSDVQGGVAGGILTTSVSSLGAFAVGATPVLFVGGNFTLAGGVAAPGVALYDGSWSAAGGGLTGFLLGGPRAFESFDDGTGPGVIAAGQFDLVDPPPSYGGSIGRFNADEWLPVGDGLFDDGNALAVFEGDLYVGMEGFGAGPGLLVRSPCCPKPSTFGPSSPGSGGFQPLISTGGQLPKIGNAQFAIRVDRGLGGAAGALFVGGTDDEVAAGFGTFLVGNIRLEIALVLSGTPGAAGQGSASVPLPLPASASLLGQDFFAQALLVDPGSTGGVSHTPGLRFQICE